MTSLPVEVLLFIESSPEQREESFCFNQTKFWRDSLINKGIIPISKKVHVFLRHPVEQILSFKSRPYFRKTSLPRETNRKSQKLYSPFKTAGEGRFSHIRVISLTYRYSRASLNRTLMARSLDPRNKFP